MEELYRIGAKVFCAEGAAIDLAEMIPIFHRWIQQKRTPHILIDVADYTHVPSGPGILLVADEGNYSLDENAGRRGLTFCRKRPYDGTLAERLTAVAREAVAAAAAIAAEPELAGRIRFSGAELEVYFNDRLHAPNTDECFARLEPELSPFFARALGAQGLKLRRSTDPRARLTVAARAAADVDLATLAARLEA
jgi:hypothetical protein